MSRNEMRSAQASQPARNACQRGILKLSTDNITSADTRRKVLDAIESFDHTYFKQRHITEATGLHSGTVNTQLKKLEDEGIVEKWNPNASQNITWLKS